MAVLSHFVALYCNNVFCKIVNTSTLDLYKLLMYLMESGRYYRTAIEHAWILFYISGIFFFARNLGGQKREERAIGWKGAFS